MDAEGQVSFQDILRKHEGCCPSTQNETVKGHNFPVRGQKWEKDLYVLSYFFYLTIAGLTQIFSQIYYLYISISCLALPQYLIT